MALLEKRRGVHARLRSHRPGGCRDGSAPRCCPARDFRTGRADVLEGRVAGFPVEAPEGRRFRIRSALRQDPVGS